MRFLLFIIALSFAFPAYAGRGIPSPYVTKGKADVAMDGFYTIGNQNDLRTRFTLDYGLTDKIGLRIRSVHDDNSDHHLKFSRAEFAVKYELAEKGELPVDLGLYLDYFKNYGSDISDNIQLRLLAAKSLPKWQHTGNIILNKRFGESLGETDLGLRFKSYYKLDSLNKIGIEYIGGYGDFNEHFSTVNENKHFFGPGYAHKFEELNLTAEFGVWFGLTRPTESTTFKWKFSYSF